MLLSLKRSIKGLSWMLLLISVGGLGCSSEDSSTLDTTTLTPDTTAPVLSNISASPTITTVAITWTTDESTTGQVDLGLDLDYGSSETDSDLSTSHTVQFSGLSSDTVYHYRITATDNAGNTTILADRTFTTFPDTAGPVLSNIGVSPAITTVTITWTTDELATGQVDLGLDLDYGFSETDSDLSTSHTIQFSDLSPDTIYHYRITSTDIAGNTTISTARTFTTFPDTTSPVLSDISASPTITTVTITWMTDEPTTSLVDMGLDQDYGFLETDSVFSRSHTVQFSGLSSDTVYHYRITATDNTGNVTISTDLMFTTLEEIAAISAGGEHNCAVTVSGGVKCWGLNHDGQLGDGTTINRLTPVEVTVLSGSVAAIAAGGEHTCALMTSGTEECWGNDDFGQVGDNTLTGVTAISAGSYHTCAVTSAGGVKCWGLNSYGQLGDGTTTNRATPVDVAGLSSEVIAIDAGVYQTCAVTSAGGVKCWGNHGLTPVDVEGLSSGVVSVVAGSNHTCALTSSGGVKCWGLTGLNYPFDSTKPYSSTPVDVTGLSSGVTAIVSGWYHACVLTSAGGVKCWGYNNRGQLGDGTSTTRNTPVDVVGLSSGVTSISAGRYHTCALTSSGGVKCWGENGEGAIGNGSTNIRFLPDDVVGFY